MNQSKIINVWGSVWPNSNFKVFWASELAVYHYECLISRLTSGTTSKSDLTLRSIFRDGNVSLIMDRAKLRQICSLYFLSRRFHVVLIHVLSEQRMTRQRVRHSLKGSTQQVPPAFPIFGNSWGCVGSILYYILAFRAYWNTHVDPNSVFFYAAFFI